jgi:hypothetical protein
MTDGMTLENALELTILAAEVGDELWPKLAARAGTAVSPTRRRESGRPSPTFALAAAWARCGDNSGGSFCPGRK